MLRAVGPGKGWRVGQRVYKSRGWHVGRQVSESWECRLRDVAAAGWARLRMLGILSES